MSAPSNARWWTPTTVAIALAIAAVAIIVVAIVLSDGDTGSGDAAAVAGPTTSDGEGGSGTGPADAPAPAEADAADDDADRRDTDAEDGTGDDPDGADDLGEASDDRDREPLVIHHVGDVNLDPSQLSAASAQDLSLPWEGVRDTFAEADLVIVNLECAATEGGEPLPKQFVFRCDLDGLPAMREAGVDVVTLANNHSGDFGVPGMVDSLRNVEAAGMVGVGVGADEAEAYRPRMVEVQGWRVAILGFGGVVPTPDWTARGDLPGQATGYDPVRMAEAVEVAAADADLVVVTVHWGEEGSFEPRAEDRTKADALIAAGADVVFGHHAHRLQPLERVAEVPVFWNLGNFVWPNRSEDASRTAVATYTVTPGGQVSACLVPFRIDGVGVPRPTGDPPSCE